jgi:hypothetical protein
MDPYLERRWRSVHTMLIAYAVDAIQPQLAGDLVARPEESVLIDSWYAPTARRTPDVAVIERPATTAGAAGVMSSQAVCEPVVLDLIDEPSVERHIEIREVDGDRVVTVIEFLSPWNKADRAGRDEYMRKRQQYFASDTNLVEVDLVRAGDWVPMVAPHRVPEEHQTTYRVSVKRAGDRKLELYPIALTQRLPAVHVPLRQDESDAKLDVQQLVDQVYQNGRYDRTDYSKPCDPPLDLAEERWAAEVLRSAGRGPGTNGA